MSSGEENTKLVQKMILREMRRLQNYYKSVIVCGIMISILLLLGAFALIHSVWIRWGVAWLGLSVLGGAAWIYLRAYQKLKQEMHFYKILLELKSEKIRIPAQKGLKYIRKAVGSAYFLSFMAGLLIALLLVAHFLDEYENSFFSALSGKVFEKGRIISDDSVFLRSLHLCHNTLDARTAVFGNSNETSWINRSLHPLSSDLIAADGACGSYSNILCRVLQEQGYKVRMLQMKGKDGQVCHILLEALSSHGWVVLDPLYDLYFITPDSRLASFDEVAGNWSYYCRQLPANYDRRYAYAGARYTNWNKIPIAMPILKKVLGYFMDNETLSHLSLRVYFLRKYRVMEYIILATLLFAFTSFKWDQLLRLNKTH